MCGHVYTTALAADITGFSLDVDMGGKDIQSVSELTATTAHIGALSAALSADSFDLNAVGTLGATTATITSLTVLHALYHCTHDTTVEAATRANTTVMCGLVTTCVCVCACMSEQSDLDAASHDIDATAAQTASLAASKLGSHLDVGGNDLSNVDHIFGELCVRSGPKQAN